MNAKTIILPALPASLDELKALPQAGLTDPFETAALVVAALCRYEADKDAAIEMINFLKGPQPLSPYEIQFLRDRLVGKGYVPRSYLRGTSPANNYQPSSPPAITVSDDLYSYQDKGYVRLQLKSSGADSPRFVKLRQKGSQWFLWENFLLPDIRQPAAEDPWA